MTDMVHLIEPVIRRYAQTFVRDAGADDLVQDTLERAVSRWHQRRSGTLRVRGFLPSRTTWRSIHLRRAARRGREVPLDDAGKSGRAVDTGGRAAA